jgi:hypothetical protein
MEAGLELRGQVEDNPGDCLALEEVELQVGADLFAGMLSRAAVSTKDRGYTVFPLPGAGVDLSADATSMPEVGGSDLRRTQAFLDIEISTECVPRHTVSGSLAFREPGATNTVSNYCGRHVMDWTIKRSAKAAAEGTTVLTLDARGGHRTELYAEANSGGGGLSTGCAAGSGSFGCVSVQGRAETETERYCLEVQAEESCSVVPAIEGVSCTIANDARRTAVGRCR